MVMRHLTRQPDARYRSRTRPVDELGDFKVTGGSVNRSCRPFAALQDWPNERSVSAGKRSSAECVGCHNSGLGSSAGPAASPSIQAHTTKRITKARHAVANANAARCIGLDIVASKILVSGRVTVCSSSGLSGRRRLLKARVRGVAREFCHWLREAHRTVDRSRAPDRTSHPADATLVAHPGLAGD
jgi:hypothetical protein